MDITTRFGRVIVGSSPAGCAATEKANLLAFEQDEKTSSIFLQQQKYERYTVPVRKEILPGAQKVQNYKIFIEFYFLFVAPTITLDRSEILPEVSVVLMAK